MVTILLWNAIPFLTCTFDNAPLNWLFCYMLYFYILIDAYAGSHQQNTVFYSYHYEKDVTHCSLELTNDSIDICRQQACIGTGSSWKITCFVFSLYTYSMWRWRVQVSVPTITLQTQSWELVEEVLLCSIFTQKSAWYKCVMPVWHLFLAWLPTGKKPTGKEAKMHASPV